MGGIPPCLRPPWDDMQKKASPSTADHRISPARSQLILFANLPAQHRNRIRRQFVVFSCRALNLCRRVTKGRPAILSIVVPLVLLARKLRESYLADKFLGECPVRRTKLDRKLRRTAGLLVNREQCPFLVAPMHGIGCDRGLARIEI